MDRAEPYGGKLTHRGNKIFFSVQAVIGPIHEGIVLFDTESLRKRERQLVWPVEIQINYR